MTGRAPKTSIKQTLERATSRRVDHENEAEALRTRTFSPKTLSERAFVACRRVIENCCGDREIRLASRELLPNEASLHHVFNCTGKHFRPCSARIHELTAS